MLDAVSLDQLRVFIAAAEEGSFSAAGRKLRRAQSLVSQAILNLESQLGVKLFDRTAKSPRLTEPGRALLQEAKDVVDRMDGLKARARAMSEGVEPELAVVFDVVQKGKRRWPRPCGRRPPGPATGGRAGHH